MYSKEQRKKRYDSFKKKGICVDCQSRQAEKGIIRCKICNEKCRKRNKQSWEKTKKCFSNIPEKIHKKKIFLELKISDVIFMRPDGIDENGILVELKKAMPYFVYGLYTTKSKYFPNLYFKRSGNSPFRWYSEFIDEQIENYLKYCNKIRVIIVKADELGKILLDRIITNET